MAADNQTLQKRGTITCRATGTFPARVVPRQLFLNLKPFRPGDIVFMTLRQQHIPPIFHRGQRFAMAAAAPEAVGIGAPHRRVLQDAEHPLIVGRLPGRCAERQSGSALNVTWQSTQYHRATRMPAGNTRPYVP